VLPIVLMRLPLAGCFGTGKRNGQGVRKDTLLYEVVGVIRELKSGMWMTINPLP